MSSIVRGEGAAVAVPEMVARLREVMSGYSRPWSLCGGWAVDAWLGRVTREHGDVDVSVFRSDCEAVFAHFAGWQLVAHGPGSEGNAALWDGRPLGTPSHLHGRPPDLITGPPPESGIMMPAEGWWLDVQIDERAVTGAESPGHGERRGHGTTGAESPGRERSAGPESGPGRERSAGPASGPGRERSHAAEEWVLHASARISLPLSEAVRESPWGVPVAAPEVVLFFKSRDLRRRDRVDFAALVPLLSARERGWLRDAIAAVGHPWMGELKG